MTKFAAFIFVLALRIMYQPSQSQKDRAPFTNPSHLPETTIHITPVKQTNTLKSSGNDIVILAKKDKEDEPGQVKKTLHQ